MTIIRFIKTTSLLILSLSLLSCTFGPKPAPSNSLNIEGLLQEAGFVRNPADTPEKMERIRSEVQRKVIPVQEEGQTYYLYADADFCQCLYVGDDSAFSRFEGLINMRKIERNTCIDDRLRSSQAEPWREFGALGGLCSDR
ncbi:hypothetical protein MUP29_04130 [bacterium]|nr:hypothetical protein [bacterium]